MQHLQIFDQLFNSFFINNISLIQKQVIHIRVKTSSQKYFTVNINQKKQVYDLQQTIKEQYVVLFRKYIDVNEIQLHGYTISGNQIIQQIIQNNDLIFVQVNVCESYVSRTKQTSLKDFPKKQIENDKCSVSQNHIRNILQQPVNLKKVLKKQTKKNKKKVIQNLNQKESIIVNIQNRKDSLFSADHFSKIQLQLERQIFDQEQFSTPVLKCQQEEFKVDRLSLDLFPQEQKDKYLVDSQKKSIINRQKPQQKQIIKEQVAEKKEEEIVVVVVEKQEEKQEEQISIQQENSMKESKNMSKSDIMKQETWESNTWEDEDFDQENIINREILINNSIILQVSSEFSDWEEKKQQKVQTHKDVLENDFNIFK